MIDVQQLAVFHLEGGGHEDADEGLCAMEAVAWLEGLEHTDRPACTCPVIAEFVRSLNDEMEEAERQQLVRYLPRLIGTVGTPAEEAARAYTVLRLARSHASHSISVDQFLSHATSFYNVGNYVGCAEYCLAALFDATPGNCLAALDAMLAIGPQARPLAPEAPARIEAWRQKVAA